MWWDPALGAPDPALARSLVSGRADALHAGLELGLRGQPDEVDYVRPLWPLNRDPDPCARGVSWRCSLAALLVRTSVLSRIGGPDPAYQGRSAAGLDLGLRMIQRGAVVVAEPDLVTDGAPPEDPVTEHDRMVFLRRHFSPKWARYAALRRAAAERAPARTARAWAAARRSTASTDRPGATDAVVERALASVELSEERVSVILPTLGRYQMLATLLRQLRVQTVAPLEVLCVDQNDRHRRDHGLYEEFADLGLRVIFQDVRGQWAARNAAVAEARGDWLAFVDDDSEIGPDFIESHLAGLLRYQADLSTGASRAVVGAPVPDNYAFFRVADQFDSGNGLCHRHLLERLGGFDEQYDRMRRGDAEFGLRVQLDGGLVIHNPDAVRVHLKADVGGLRTVGSWDGFRSVGRTGPLPLPSMVYYAKRYHTPRQVREDLLIGLAQSIVPYHLKRRARPAQWARFALAELSHVPGTVRRVRESVRRADAMVAEGPRIPSVAPADRQPR